MNRIKRWFAIALCALCLLGVLPASAETQVISVAPQSAAAMSGAALGDTFYFYMDQLYACKPGETEAVALGGADEFAVPPTLFVAGEDLLRLDNLTGQLARWDGESFADTLQMYWNGAADPDDASILLWPVWTDDALYGLLASNAGANVSGFPLVRFDLATGERTDLPAFAYQLAPYKDGMLLGLQLDLLRYNGTGGGTVVAMDARTGNVISELVTLSGLMDGGIAYDAASDTVYAASGGQVTVSVAGGAFVPGPYFNVPTPLNGVFSGVINDWYAVFTDHQLHLCKLNGESAGLEPLRIKGFGLDEDMLQAFGRAHPDVPVARTDVLMSDTAAIIGDFASAADQADLYVLYSFQSLEALKDKDYLADLSDVPGVSEAVAAMYPAVRDAVTRDGKVLALPAGLQVSGAWRVNDGLLAQFGLEMPATMLEYFELLKQWEEDFAYDNPEYALTTLLLPREQCVSLALQSYGLTYETPDAPLTLDTPLFRAILEAIDALPYEPMDLEAIQSGAAPMPAMPNARPIIETGTADVFNRYGESDDQGRPLARVIPPLPFEEGVPAAVMTMMPVYVINPNGPHREFAERFVAFAVQEMSAENRILLCPDFNDPQRPADYETEIAALRDELAELEAALPDVAETERRAAEDQLAVLRERLETREAEDFAISAQAIADYRVLAEHLNLLTHSSIVNLDNPEASQELNSILIRYIAGQNTLDEALRELDRRFQMMYMERVSR